jgi:hypothetical protein
MNARPGANNSTFILIERAILNKIEAISHLLKQSMLIEAYMKNIATGSLNNRSRNIE